MKIKNPLVFLGLFITILFSILLYNPLVSPSQANITDLSHIFGNTIGAFVLYAPQDNQYTYYNEERCNQNFSPMSTFKIPNSIISLETGAIADETITVSYDSQKYPSEDWWPPQWKQENNLRSALKYSVVWFYRELALKVGTANMKKYLAHFKYGNQDISGGLDKFWLSSSLKISPKQQVEFLRRFYTDELLVSKRTADIVKDILVLEETDTYKLSAKTGTGFLENENILGWLVGYLEKSDDVYFFALNLEGKQEEASRKKRLEMTKQIFTQLGIL